MSELPPGWAAEAARNPTGNLLDGPGRNLHGSTLVFSSNPLGPGPGELSPSVANQPHRVIDVQGAPQRVQPLTVTGAVLVVGDPGNPDWILRASWASFGWRTSCDIDLVRGTIFTVFANSLQVDVLATDPQNEGGHAGAVGAFVSYGVRPNNAQFPTRTFRLVADGGGSSTIAPGGISNTIPIPAYARNVFVMPGITGADGDQDYALRFSNSTGSQVARFRGQNGILASQVAIPIPNDADNVHLANIDTTQSMSAPRLVFGLAL